MWGIMLCLLILFGGETLYRLYCVGKGDYEKQVSPLENALAMLMSAAMFGVLLYAFLNWV